MTCNEILDAVDVIWYLKKIISVTCVQRVGPVIFIVLRRCNISYKFTIVSELLNSSKHPCAMFVAIYFQCVKLT